MVEANDNGVSSVRGSSCEAGVVAWAGGARSASFAFREGIHQRAKTYSAVMCDPERFG